MPLIRCTNVFYQGRLSRHITSPTEKPRPESWPGDYMDTAVVIIPPLPPNVTNNRAKQQLTPSVEKKTCSSTKGGLLRYIHYTYSEFAICILLAYQMPLIRCTKRGYPVTFITSALRPYYILHVSTRSSPRAHQAHPVSTTSLQRPHEDQLANCHSAPLRYLVPLP